MQKLRILELSNCTGTFFVCIGIILSCKVILTNKKLIFSSCCSDISEMGISSLAELPLQQVMIDSVSNNSSSHGMRQLNNNRAGVSLEQLRQRGLSRAISARQMNQSISGAQLA